MICKWLVLNHFNLFILENVIVIYFIQHVLLESIIFDFYYELQSITQCFSEL